EADSSRVLFDYLVSQLLQLGSHVDPQRTRCLQVDHQFKLGRLLYRQISRLNSLQYFVDQYSGSPKQVRDVRAVGQESVRLAGKSTSIEQYRQLHLRSKFHDFVPISRIYRRKHEECVRRSIRGNLQRTDEFD